MKPLNRLFAAVLLCAAQAAAAEDSFQGALERAAAVHPSQYSFADLYRATVGGSAAPLFAAAQPAGAPLRVATAQPAAQFSISEAREPRLWLLVLSGIAAALWVARRRLGYGL
jgi:hypothetical protein